MLNTGISVLIIISSSSLRGAVKKFLLYTVTVSSSALLEHLFLVVKSFYGRPLLLSESSMLNRCVGKCNLRSCYTVLDLVNHYGLTY